MTVTFIGFLIIKRGVKSAAPFNPVTKFPVILQSKYTENRLYCLYSISHLELRHCHSFAISRETLAVDGKQVTPPPLGAVVVVVVLGACVGLGIASPSQ